jgi:transcriptional regulator with XRE-family HTH domain
MTSANSRKLVAALRKKRNAEGLSIRALSAKIGVSFSALARIERGEGEPDNNSTIRILNWLGTEAQEYGLSFQDTALVHFRAAKNIGSKTVHCLLQAADVIKKNYSFTEAPSIDVDDEFDSGKEPTVSLSKSEMEEMAENLRAELNVQATDPLDALNIRVIGVDVLVPTEVEGLGKQCLAHLMGAGKNEWSAMSVPIDSHDTRWVILRNKKHNIERQRVTYLEECWHILLGHKLTRIAKVADAYGRTFDSNEEHDAYYLAAATLLPREVVVKAVEEKRSPKSLAVQYGVSTELVEYRIKRLGLWKTHRGISVSLADDS